MQKYYKIVIADDHPLFRTALRQAVSTGISNTHLIEAESIDSLQHILEQQTQIDLILLDLFMPGAHGYSGLLFLRGNYSNIPIVIVSALEEPQVIQQTIAYGASGFIPKSSSLKTICTALQTVLNGNIWIPESIDQSQHPVSDPQQEKLAEQITTLTPQQYKVLSMLTEGKQNKQIAFELNLSEATIKAHATAIFKKLGVRNRTQAVIAIKQLKLENPALFSVMES
ncbi:response regulator transcription factor [Zooshikella marina]|uniref:response regulator transcription factor n=1 Tax=Zooshikella ganghwensis TaxID=202772 RepID=UPI001BAF73F4|nr:response regulator transcription factor [Zooshikella ganghwensis]MBU2704868.1 response regulator transcription factor [Zooshikella ganghwensis]